MKASFLNELERAVRDILNSKDDVSITERLKAVEMGAKLLQIRHRIEGSSGEGEDGKFFSKAS